MGSILKGIAKGSINNLQGDANDFYESNDSNNPAARLVKHVKVAKDYLGKDPEPKEPEEKDSKEETNESYWGGPSPAQLRFNRALERERKKSEPESERAKKELDRIMGPRPVQPKDEPDNSKPVTEKTSPEIFNRPKNAPIFSTKPKKIGNYIFDASEFEGSMVYGKDAKGLVVKAYDPKNMDVIGSASFVLVRKKGKNGDSWLESDDTKVKEKYRGKGIATAMYQYAKDLGNDIKPSPYKSNAGGEMWKAWGRDVFEEESKTPSGTTDAGYTWQFEPGSEVPMKPDVDANTFIRVRDAAGKTICGVWADVAGDSIEIEYSQVFDDELRGRGVYTDLLKSLSKQYTVISDTDTNNAAAGIYRRLGADYDHRGERHTLRKQGVAEGSEQKPVIIYTNNRGATIDDDIKKSLPVTQLPANKLQMWEKHKSMKDPKIANWVTNNLLPELKQNGVLKPLLVWNNDGEFFVIDGNHRFIAYQVAGYQGRVPVQIVPDNMVNISDTLPGQQGVAEGTNVNVGGIQLTVAIDGAEVIIRSVVDGYQAGYVVFDRDGRTLVPADLAIDDEFRGRGIAKIIYDYVKSLGFTIRRSSDQTRAGKHFWDKNRGEDSQVWEQTMTAKELDEACWKGYHKKGMKTMFGKRYPNCVKNTNEDHQECPECGGPMFSEEMINEKKDACYYKVKSRYKVWPSAYASGALVQCRKKGSSNWGTKSESSILEGIEQTDENLHKWFKEKWVRFGPDGKIRGACARGDDSEGKPKCLPQSKAQNLGKKGRASAASRKRREDPNPERSGKAINVATKKKTSESSILQGISETKGLPMPGSYEQEYGPFKNKGGYRIMTLTSEQEELEEKWSNKYKRSIDCSHPKGFSQRAHCQGKKKK
jgi:GNAT superfamily N-acetyltransferase